MGTNIHMLSKNVQKIEAQEHTHNTLHAKGVFNWDIKGLLNFETILLCEQCFCGFTGAISRQWSSTGNVFVID